MKILVGEQGQWAFDTEKGRIGRIDGKFHTAEILSEGYDRVVISQPAGEVFITLVQFDNGVGILCEYEKIFENGRTSQKVWRAVRASIDNPDQPKISRDIFLGESHSNSQRIIGQPDKYYLQVLDTNPDPEKYSVLTLNNFAKTKDNFGKTGLTMAQASELVSDELAADIAAGLRRVPN
jgi:hypothetical protein